MAKNQRLPKGDNIPNFPVPSGTLSGDPITVGFITGVANGDRDANGNTTLVRCGSFDLTVKGHNGAGNSAVAVGDIIYFNSGSTPKLDKNAAGVRFGTALSTLASGATGTVEVLLDRS